MPGLRRGRGACAAVAVAGAQGGREGRDVGPGLRDPVCAIAAFGLRAK